MIKPIQMFTVICDGCGKDAFEDGDYSAWNIESFALEQAKEADFEEIDGKHYCPNCYERDEDGEPQIKEKNEQTTN